jgi:voltage-gated potassium channel
MKFLLPQLYFLLRDRPTRINILNLFRFLGILAGVITLYSVIFHYIMAWEGQTQHSWVSGFYWTLVTMSTLGYGDITFNSDLGRVFATIVILSGIVFLLILLPFTFIEFFYAPWLKAQAAARAPAELPEKTRDHVVLTALDAVTTALIERLNRYQYPYVLLVPELTEALRLHDLGYRVVLGELDDPETYRKVRVANALLVATTASDRANTNVAFTVREISERVPIVATANAVASVDILELAGCNHVLQLGEMMGQAMARRVLGGDTQAHVIGEFGSLLIAETLISGDSPLAGLTLAQARLRERLGMSIVGVWERGNFEVAEPERLMHAGEVLVMAGTAEQFEAYNRLAPTPQKPTEPVVIIGGGRVGRAAGRALAASGLDYRIVELLPERVRDPEKYIVGDAADLAILVQAGIRTTATVIITTRDDDTNIYLTIYCRRLRPDIQIIGRSRLERNIATLHRAGADMVMSYGSMGANTILTILHRSDVLMVAEGLDFFKIKVPHTLANRTLAQTTLRRATGCTVVALSTEEGMVVNPDPHMPLPANAEMVLIGTTDAENRFLDRYGKQLD